MQPVFIAVAPRSTSSTSLVGHLRYGFEGRCETRSEGFLDEGG